MPGSRLGVLVKEGGGTRGLRFQGAALLMLQI